MQQRVSRQSPGRAFQGDGNLDCKERQGSSLFLGLVSVSDSQCLCLCLACLGAIGYLVLWILGAVKKISSRIAIHGNDYGALHVLYIVRKPGV